MPEPDMSVWHGRVDTADGPDALRWHQMVKALAVGAEPGIVLVGFACDEGVRRNGGRVGAKDGPRAIRAAMGNFAWHQASPVYDAGDIRCDDGDMEGAQSRLAEVVAEAIRAGHRPLVLGGGHETAWGTFQGIVNAKPRAAVGVINIDAHLDLRADEPGNSGTPFAQIQRWLLDRNKPFNYFCLGTAKHSNTKTLFDRADQQGVVYLPDIALPEWLLETAHQLVESFVYPRGSVHLSIDLDVLPAAVMPAVSAPAARGVCLDSVEALIGRTLAHGKVAAVDLVEFAPNFDRDGNAARTAARLAWLVATNWPEWG